MHQKGHVLLIVLLIAAAVGGYLIYSGKNNLNRKIAPQQTTQTTVDETANWKTYEKGVITFKYPSTWETGPENTDYIVSNDGKIEKTLTMNQVMFEGTFDSWCKKDVVCKTYTDIQKTEVANQKAYKYTFTKECNGCNYPFTTYYILNDSTQTLVEIIKTTYTKPTDTSHQEEVDALQDPIFDKILSTFKFLDQSQINQEELTKYEKMRMTGGGYDEVQRIYSPDGRYIAIKGVIPDLNVITIKDKDGKIIYENIISASYDAIWSNMRKLGLQGSGQSGYTIKKWKNNTELILQIGVADGSEFETEVDVTTGKIIDSSFKRIK